MVSVLSARYSTLAAFFLTFLLSAAGCGYHTVGHSGQLPESVKTIAVPAFKNETLTYRIEQMLTSSVVREFTTRTHYRILNNVDDADATLTGTVVSTVATPLTYDTSTGRAASVLVVVNMRVNLTDRSGKVLYQNPSYVFFRELRGDGPVGAEGVALTAGRSLAVDPAFLPLGVPIWIDIAQDGRALRRLVVAQDTGGAIRGPVRGDLFWGFGPDAEAAAGSMRAEGAYYLLLPKRLAERQTVARMR